MWRFRRAIGACLLVLGVAAYAAAEAEPWKGDSIIRDPEWRKRFLGSYGFLSGAEPSIPPSELELLREVIELMKANPRAAAARLQGSVGPGSSASLDYVLANLEFQTGDVEGAAGHYASALEKFPDFRRAHKNLGLLMVQKGDCKSALRHLSSAVELGDRDDRNFGLIGYCYIQVENHLAAEQAYRNAILQNPEVRDWKDGLARSLLGMNKHQEAAALFGSLIDENPEDATAWMLQANAFLGLQQPEKAAVNLEAVRVLGKAQLGSLVLLGDIYMNEGAPDLAKSAYLEAIERDEKGTEYRAAYRAADVLVRTGALAQADELIASIDARYAKGLDDDQKLELLTLKARQAMAQGRDEEAAKLLESIVRQDGTRGDALIQLATYYHRKGDQERAELYIERAQKLAVFEYKALLEHAQFRVAEKDYARAAELLREAISIKREPRVERFLARVEQAVRS